MRTASEIRKSIKSVFTAAGKLQSKIHELALECLQHAETHGDVTLIDLMVKEMPKGQRVEALIAWVQTFSPIRWGGDGTVGLLKAEAKNFTPFNVETAGANPYYDLTKERKVTPLTLEQLKAIVTRLGKRIDKAAEEGNIAEGEDVEAMRAYVRRLATVDTPPVAAVNQAA